MTYKVIFLRHGQSQWNLENRFTGWTDVPLSDKGVEEARAAGKLLKAEGFSFDAAYTSTLKRAIKTLWLVLEEMDEMWIPVTKDWHLNERHYGALPLTECLKDTVERVLPYWNDVICPEIRAGKSLIIAAHGNSLRALIKYLDNVSDEEIIGLNIPTGIPLLYELDENMRPVSHRYLGDEEAAKAAAEAVANQAKKK